MKRKLLQLLFLVVMTSAYGQVGIGTAMPDSSSQLDIVAGNKGILIPRLKLTSTRDVSTISSGNVNSLLVFNTATTTDITPGYYYWFEDRWNRISISTDVIASQSNVIFNPVTKDFSYSNNGGNVQVINFQEIVQAFEVVTTLVSNNDGTYTYTNEAGTAVIINANTTAVAVVNGVYTFRDAAGNIITTIDTKASASIYNNTTSGLTASNVQSAIDELVTKLANTTDALVNNNNGTYTHTTVDGKVIIIDANTTKVTVANGVYTFTDAAGNTITTIDTNASASGYNNSASGLTASNVQSAIDELVTKFGNTTDALVNNNNGTYTHTTVDGKVIIIDANTTKVTVANGVYTFTDAGGVTITTIDTNANASGYNNTASGLTASNVQSAIDELATTIKTNKGNLTVAGGLEFTGGTDGVAKLLANAGIQVADGGITSTQLANDAVTTAKIADGAVTNVKVGTDAITSDKILDGEVKTTDLATGAVSADKLIATVGEAGKVATVNADGTVSYKDISSTNLVDKKGVTTDGIIKVNGVNALAESVLLDADLSIAAGGITSTQLANNAVTTDKIADGSVTNVKVGTDAITSDKILDGEVKTTDLATGAVSADKLIATVGEAGKVATVNADGTVSYKDISSTNLADKKGVTTDGIIKVNGLNALAESVLLDAQLSIAAGGIGSTQLANDAVTTAKIADGAVSNVKVGADAITSDKILDGEVKTADLATGAVSADKLSADATLVGKVATVNADGTVTYKDISTTNLVDKKGVTTDGIIKVNGVNALTESVLLDAALSIAAGGITSNELATDAVTTDKIAAGAVTNTKVGADAITSDKILDGEVQTADLATGAVTADKLIATAGEVGKVATVNADGTVTYKDISTTNLVDKKGVTTDGIIKVNGVNALTESVLLDAALSIAAGGITSNELATDAVTTDKIAAGAVTNTKVGADAITSDKILDGEVQTADLATGAVTADKLIATAGEVGKVATVNADGTVTYKDISTTNLVDKKGVTTDGIIKVNGVNALTESVLLDAALSIAAGGITSNELATDAVTTDKIAAGAVTNTKVGADAITSDKILDGEVQTADLATGAVTADKLIATAGEVGKVATVNADGTVTYKDISTTNLVDKGNLTVAGGLEFTVGTDGVAKLLADAGIQVATGGITSTQLAANAVITSKIANDAVTTDKIANGGPNQVLTTDISGAPTWIDQSTVTVTAKNGLHKDGLDIKLGGALIEETTIITDATKTLAITGLDNKKVQNTDATKDYLMAVNDAGVVRALKAAMPKFFYMPSIVMPTANDQFVIGDGSGFSEAGGVFTVNLYDRYNTQFGSPKKSNAAKVTTLPVLPAMELDYHITWYDETVFDNVTISDLGVLTYTIKPTPEVTVGTFMNIVFAVRPTP